MSGETLSLTVNLKRRAAYVGGVSRELVLALRLCRALARTGTIRRAISVEVDL